MFTVEAGPDVRVVCRQRKVAGAADVYVTVAPATEDADGAECCAAAWDAVASLLDEHDAAIVEERVFVAPALLSAARAARARALADRDDGVEPVWLIGPPHAGGGFAGLIIHAVAGGTGPEPLPANGRPRGRRWRHGAYTLVTGANLHGVGSDPSTQARTMFDAAESLLAGADAGLADVSRTWLWLRDILAWYDDLNRVRNERFRERDLLRADGAGRLPASTGIGAAPADGHFCAMDFAADLGPTRFRPLLGAGRQNPASRYGSAFSRAAVAETPFGRKVYVSGTAAIDAEGRTLHAGDARSQISETVRCVRAVLASADAADADVVQAIVYCKTPEIARLYRAEVAPAGWPAIVTVADVCRDDLLFEMECTAMVGAE